MKEVNENIKNRSKGIMYTIISAVIFGFTPILAKYTFMGGSNAAMLTFFRAFMSLPFIYIILACNRIPLRTNPRQFKQIVVLSLASGLTTVTLYGAYEYISVGMATTIHFVYPMAVVAVCILFFKEKVSVAKVMALAMSTVGILMFFDGNMAGGVVGIIMAALSGIFYSLYIVFMDKTELKDMYPLKLTFYICMINSVIMLIYAGISKQLTFSITPMAYIYSLIIALLASIGGVTLMQMGVKYVGATTASILCTFEPITSVILGIILLGEVCNVRTIVGCAMVIAAVAILSVYKNKE